MTEEEVAKRTGFGKERYEKQDFQKKVRQIYQELFKQEGYKISGNLIREEIHNRVVQIVESRLKELQSNPSAKENELQRLW